MFGSAFATISRIEQCEYKQLLRSFHFSEVSSRKFGKPWVYEIFEFFFFMVDGNFVLDQLHEILLLVAKLSDLKIIILDSLQVSAIIA